MSHFDLDPESFERPFPEFVRSVIAWVEAADWIQDSDPMFHFARAVKGYTTTKQLPADKAYAAVLRAAPKRPIAVSLPVLDLWTEDGEVAFHRMWERVRFPMGTDPVDVACALAGDGALCTQKTRPGKYPRFLTVAALLQIQVRAKPILLPVRKLADAFPCQPNSITAWIGWAREDGVLIKVREHAFRSTGDSRAAEYVFGLHCWKNGLDRVAGLLAVNVTPADLAWTRERFAEVAATGG